MYSMDAASIEFMKKTHRIWNQDLMMLLADQ